MSANHHLRTLPRPHPKHRDIVMTEGKILPAVVLFVIPLVLAGILQMLYNAADIIVIGNFAGKAAYASVGATSSIISLIVNTVITLAVGSNIILARYLGAGNAERVSHTVHTSFLFSLLVGTAVMIGGELSAPALLHATGCPAEVLDGAVLYMRIYYIGAPASFFYNFMSSVLRTKGDSRRPLYYLAISGLVNVALNLLLVIVFHLGVAGVAIATVASQYLSASLVFIRLVRLDDCCRLIPSHARIHLEELKKIVRFGLPSAISSGMYSLTNVQIQSAINSFGQDGISGNSTAISVESFLSAAIATFSVAASAFVGQNIGAGKRERVPKIIRCLYFCGISVSIIAGIPMILFGENLLSIYLPGEEAAIDFGLIRFRFIIGAMFLNAINQVNSGALQAFGFTAYSMMISIVGVCGFRFLWMGLIYPNYETAFSLYLCYPISWFAVTLAGCIAIFLVLHRYRKGKDFAI